MSDTNRVQEWRKRQKDQGKEPVTVWLSREEKRRLEGLAKTWHCSTSELVQQAWAAYHPENSPVTAAVTDTEQLRQCITATVTDIVTATLPTMVREIVEEQAREPAPLPVTATGNRDGTVTEPLTRAPVSQPSPEKAALVARLREMRAQRLSMQQMANELNSEGVPTLSGKGRWQKGTVAKLLINREPGSYHRGVQSYRGHRTWGRQ
jgi:hypothetical protein